MGVRFNSGFSSTFVGPLPANATETIICTLPPLTIPIDSTPIVLFAFCALLFGTGTTTATYGIRRGTTVAGALVNGATFSDTGVAGNLVSTCAVLVDVPGAVGGQQYILTVQQVGATAAGTVGAVTITALAL